MQDVERATRSLVAFYCGELINKRENSETTLGT